MALKLELQISMLKRVLIKVFPAITVKRILDEVSCQLTDKPLLIDEMLNVWLNLLRKIT